MILRCAFCWLLLCVAAPEALACSCSEDNRSWNEVISEADALYLGRAVSARLVEGNPDAELIELQHDMVEATLEVERWWKGGASHEARFLTGNGGGDCGVFVQLGAWYIVEAYEGPGGRHYTSVCMRTDLAIVPEGVEVPEGLSGGYVPRRTGLLLLVLCAGLVMIGVVVIVGKRIRSAVNESG